MLMKLIIKNKTVSKISFPLIATSVDTRATIILPIQSHPKIKIDKRIINSIVHNTKIMDLDVP